ncbi:unnamed protein product [Sordaria macrospora k-hell]|uniref:WGS project CABT00000000 data, contig 2.4 n=1 Tax=Sordaria macrospora (strain ATCC MYA-333 / DSM 997 / K(L3346) / K-hell) TaxID=771870 RepID=F7VQG9_SORMK|nr:uncharacterized protein SMAC_01318 [Sordaria macrospora k-hell]CCC07751.1 unnamed protein product [Sordaria macrospora k-hell]
MAQPLAITAADTEFCEATPEQRELAWKLNGVAWARPVSIETYVAREIHLSEQELTKDGNCKYWVLYLKGYPRQIIASCETTRKEVLISENGVSRGGYGYGIASVYTNPDYRRQGMAATLLRHVQEAMDRDSDLSVLYSDIGRQYYSNLGWHVFPSEEVTLTYIPPTSTSSNETPALQHTQPESIRYLRIEELRNLCDVDKRHLCARFSQIPADGASHVAFMPSFAQMSWQIARAEFVAGKLLNGKSPENRGAITSSGRAWIYWDHDWKSKKLKVLKVVTVMESSPQQRINDIRVLVEAALVEATTWGSGDRVVVEPR